MSSIAELIKSNPCPTCRAGGYPVCKCRPGSGGGSKGGSGSGSQAKDKNGVDRQFDPATSALLKEFEQFKSWVVSELFSYKKINYQAGLVSLESDRLLGNLTLRVLPGLSPSELKLSRQFLKTIEKAFDEFKNGLTEQGISTKNFKAVPKENEISIHIPNPYFSAFINYLDSKNLLPIPHPKTSLKSEELNRYERKEKNRRSLFDDILSGPQPKKQKQSGKG